MNRTFTYLFGLLFLGGAVLAYGGQFSPDYEHLKPLEWQIGDWVTEFQATSDAGPFKKGDKVTVNASIRWSPERSFLVNNSSSEVNGKKVVTGLEINFWNREKSIISHSHYGTFGSGQGVWTKVGDKAELEWTIEGQHGTFKGKSYLTRGDDSWEWQIKEQTQNGERIPVMPLTTFRRKTGAPAGELWQAFQEAVVGTWNGKGLLGSDDKTLGLSKGDPFEYRITWRPDLEGRILVGEGEFRVVGKAYADKSRLFAGWDPDAGNVRLTAFWSSGLVEEGTYQRKQGTAFLGTYTEKTPGGQTRRARLSSDFPDANTNVLKLLDGPRKGETLSSFKREK
ncbi:MAG: hypothetical protein ACOX1P_24565 [Thermoguttaceae bacterium]|jgi:hypothetical protein